MLAWTSPIVWLSVWAVCSSWRSSSSSRCSSDLLLLQKYRCLLQYPSPSSRALQTHFLPPHLSPMSYVRVCTVLLVFYCSQIKGDNAVCVSDTLLSMCLQLSIVPSFCLPTRLLQFYQVLLPLPYTFLTPAVFL